MRSLIIARLTFLEAGRRRILLAALVLGIVFLIVFALGFNFILEEIERDGGREVMMLRNQAVNFLVIAGFYVINFLTIMLSVLTSVDTVAGEISSGTIQTIVTKPMGRWEVLVGKWLGFIGLLTLYVLLMAGGLSLLVAWLADYTIPNLAAGLVLLWMNGVIVLTVSLWGGTFLSTLANGVLVFGLFGIAFVGGWIEQIGSLFENQAAINIGIITSLLLPTEAIWKRAVFEMQSPIATTFGVSPFTAGQSAPSDLMIGYALGFIIFGLFWGIRIFSKRDL